MTASGAFTLTTSRHALLRSTQPLIRIVHANGGVIVQGLPIHLFYRAGYPFELKYELGEFFRGHSINTCVIIGPSSDVHSRPYC